MDDRPLFRWNCSRLVVLHLSSSIVCMYRINNMCIVVHFTHITYVHWPVIKCLHWSIRMKYRCYITEMLRWQHRPYSSYTSACPNLFIDGITSITWTSNFSTYNNQDLAMWLRRWKCKLDIVPSKGSNPTVDKNFSLKNFCLLRVSRSWTGSAHMK